MSQYYVIQVLTGKEFNVKEIFLKSCVAKFGDLDVEIIIPQVGMAKFVRKTYKTTYKPVLPGYVILKCNDLTNELYYSLKKITGVVRVVRISVCYEEVKRFISTCHDKLAEFKKRLEFVKRIVLEKGRLAISRGRVIGERQEVKVNYPKRRGYIPVFRMIRLLN